MRRVLPGNIYDGLALSALAFGGIGAGNFHVHTPEGKIPYCALGHAEGKERYLNEVAIYTTTNDSTVCAVNGRKGKKGWSRITFREWCRELHVVRGD